MTDTDFAHFNKEEDFVEDINDHEDDVERQIDQTIAAYNKNKDHYGFAFEGLNKQSDFSRNRVTSAKPDWGNRRDVQTNQDQQTGEDYQESQPAENLGSNKQSFYERFAAYVAQNHMLPDDIFTLDKDKLTSDEFKEMLDIAGFEYTHEELEDTLFDITNAHFLVVVSNFTKKIKTWKAHLNKEKALEALMDNTIKMAQNSRKKLSKVESTPKSFIVRPQSSMMKTPQGQGGKNNKSTRPFSGISGISSAKSKHTFGNTQNDYFKTSETENFQRSNYENKSALYLQESKKRDARNEKLLKMTLDKAQSEQEYDCMEKMAEANDFVQGLGQPITYKPYNSEDGTLKCHVYEYDKLVAELTLKEFLREYRNLKYRNNSNQRVPIWETLTKQKSSGANFYFSSAKTLQNEPSEELEAYDMRRGVKKDRQKELKTVLFETMKLSDILQGQLEKLKKAGLGAESQAHKH